MLKMQCEQWEDAAKFNPKCMPLHEAIKALKSQKSQKSAPMLISGASYHKTLFDRKAMGLSIE